jgi:hypothetical protein
LPDAALSKKLTLPRRTRPAGRAARFEINALAPMAFFLLHP